MIKKLINDSNPTIYSIKDDYKSLAKYFNVDISNFYSQKLITDKVVDLILKDLDGTETTNYINFEKLKNTSKALVYEQLLLNENNLRYINIFQTLFAIKKSTLKRITPFDDTEKWKRIISNIKNYQILSVNSFTIVENEIRDNYPQVYDRALELKKLEKHKCIVTIQDGEIKISNTESVFNELDKLISKIGGLTLAKTIFKIISQNNYSDYFKRYHLTRNGNGLDIYKRPQIPFGYLLNLSVKYPYENKSISENHLKKIIELSIAIVSGIYNVQHYSQWTGFFQTGDTIIKYLSEIAMWDSMYSIIQIRPELSISINNELFNIIENSSFKESLGFSKEEYQQIVTSIYKRSKDKNGPVMIFISQVYNANKNIKRETIQKIFEILSHNNRANNNYKLPSDITNVDFQFRPLIKFGKSKFLLMDKSWCAPAFFESIANGLRKSKIKDFDSKIGYSIEQLIYKSLTSNNIKFSTGNYKMNEIEGECDLVVESKNSIILFEFKKKVLTRKAKSGIDINLLIDLSDSLLSSQIQAGRTEIILLDKKEITLVNTKENKTTKIELKNRSIERVSLTQLDFGGFHDRTLINQFFNALLTHNYGTFSEDKTIVKKFKQLSEKQKIWIEQYNKINALDDSFKKFPFFNCCFLNLGNLLEIIKLSDDNETFNEKIASMKYTTFGTYDFYKEFELKNNLNT